MNPLHLIWMLPLAMAAGAFLMAVLIGGTDHDQRL